MAKFLCMQIGTSSVHLAEVMKKGGSYTILKTFSFDTPDDATKDGKVRVSDAVVAAIKKGLTESGILSTDVYFAVDSTKILFAQVERPFLQKNMIASMLQNSFSEIFPVDELLYHISYVFRKSFTDGKMTKKMLLDVFATPNDLSESYYNLAVALNLNIKGLAPAGYSMTFADPMVFDNQNIATVSIGESISTLTVTTNGNTIFNKTIPHGVHEAIQHVINSPVTYDLDVTSACELLYSQNILLKTKPTETTPSDTDTDKLRIATTMAISGYAENIATAFSTIISKENITLQAFLLNGLGAGFAEISQLLASIFEIPVTVMQQYSKFNIAPEAAEDTLLIGCYPCASACFDVVNLFTKAEQAGGDIAKKKMIDKAFLISMVIVICAVFCYSLISVVTNLTKKIDAQNNLKVINDEIAFYRANHVQERYNEYVDAETKNQQIRGLYSSTMSGNEDMRIFINSIEDVMPNGSYVTSMTLTPTSATVSITSETRQIAAYILHKFRALNTITSVNCEGISEKKDGGGYAFTCNFSLKPMTPTELADGSELLNEKDANNPNLINNGQNNNQTPAASGNNLPPNVQNPNNTNTPPQQGENSNTETEG